MGGHSVHSGGNNNTKRGKLLKVLCFLRRLLQMPKPLLWERLKFTERFSFVNSSKIVHVVMDDVINVNEVQNDVWYHERLQTSKGVDSVKRWALNTGHLSQDDIFISADVDEVMSPTALHKIRWCELEEDVTFGALWMPLGNLQRAYKIEFHVTGKPHTFGLPTIYKWKGIISEQYDGSRQQSRWKKPRDKFVEGGIHMTHPAFLPNHILKQITATERSKKINNFCTDIYRGVSLDHLNQQQGLIYTLDYKQDWLFPMLLDPLSKASDITPHVPWFLSCNKERFPYWFGDPDPRNREFLSALQCSQKNFWGEELKLFIEEGCFEESAQDMPTRPCLEGWVKLKMKDTPVEYVGGAAGWGRYVPSVANNLVDGALYAISFNIVLHLRFR